MDNIKIPITKFEQTLQKTGDFIYCGILKREFATKKFTMTEWQAVLSMVKARKVSAKGKE